MSAVCRESLQRRDASLAAYADHADHADLRGLGPKVVSAVRQVLCTPVAFASCPKP